MDPLANVGGCPNEWQELTNDPEQTKYEAGDMVSLNGLVYKCNSDPYSEHCGSAGYQPEEDVASKSPESLFYSLSLFSQYYKLTDFNFLSQLLGHGSKHGHSLATVQEQLNQLWHLILRH